MKKANRTPLFLTLYLAMAAAFAAPAPDGAPLWPSLEQAGATTSLAAIGIASPRTLFIPARFADSGVGSLWLSGRKVVFPQGSQDVIGFVPGNDGYRRLVRPARRRPRVRSTGARQRGGTDRPGDVQKDVS